MIRMRNSNYIVFANFCAFYVQSMFDLIPIMIKTKRYSDAVIYVSCTQPLYRDSATIAINKKFIFGKTLFLLRIAIDKWMSG